MRKECMLLVDYYVNGVTQCIVRNAVGAMGLLPG